MSALDNQLDLSLDELIKQRRSENSRDRSNNDRRRRNEGRFNNTPYTRNNPGPSSVDLGKILISNLHSNVSERDLRELFSQVGRIRSALIHFSGNGRSLGTGQVVFVNHSDALIAVKKYHGVTLDGLAMKIAIPFTPTNDMPSVGSRLGPVRGRNFNDSGRRRVGRNSRPRSERDSRPKASKEDLDAELDSYFAEGTNDDTTAMEE